MNEEQFKEIKDWIKSLNEQNQTLVAKLQTLEEQNQTLAMKLQALEGQNDEILNTIKKISIPSNLEDLMLRINSIVRNIEMKVRRAQ